MEKNVPHYQLVNDITGENYKEFIAYCLEHATHFSLKLHGKKKGQNISAIQNLSEKYGYQPVKTYLWYTGQKCEEPFHILLYDTHPEALDFFVKYYGQIFPNTDRSIEDLCFFYQDRLIFGSITHAKIAEFFPSGQLRTEEFLKWGQWEKRESTKNVSVFPSDIYQSFFKKSSK